MELFTGQLFIPFLTGSKTPSSRFERNKEEKWEITARKDRDERLTSKSGEATGGGVLSVESFANHQWGMKKTPTDVSLTLCLSRSCFFSSM
jgi:hypothetical protein